MQHAPKIFTETCELDWKRSLNDLHNQVRGLSPFPAAFTYLDGKMLKIFRSKKEAGMVASAPGSVVTDQKTFLKFAAADGYLQVLELQLEGKKRMPAEAFLRGYKINQ